MASERVTLSDIPTLTDLYASGDLVASSKNGSSDSDQSQSDEETSTRKQPMKSINDRVSVRKVDITTLQVDAIVNAANTSLLGGGGVDGAIHRAAGEGLLRECEELDGCETGKAKITKGYELPAKHVIHTVGPIFHYGKVEKAQKLLRSCYSTSLQLAVENGCRSIAFSAISTGVYGYPSNQAAYDACKTVREFLEGEDGEEIDRVIFCTFMPKDVNAYRNELPVWFPPPKEEAEQEAES